MITVHNVYSDQVVFLGDLHGNFDTLLFWLKNFVFKNTTIIVCGDIGFGFHKPQYYRLKLEEIDKFCKESDCKVLFFRGNHDDPEYFDGGYDNKKRSSVTFDCARSVHDYSCVQVWEGNKVVHTILCVGGGVSVDRAWRIKNDIINAGKYARHAGVSLEEAKKKLEPTYWKEELPTYNDEVLSELAESGMKIDIVCTHTCPSFVGLKDKDGVRGWMEIDPELENDLNRERGVMDELWKRLKEDGHPISMWIYGHFHKHMDEEFEGVRFIMLDMCRPERSRFDSFEIKCYELQ